MNELICDSFRSLVSTFTSGGLSQNLTETQTILAIVIFLVIWLTVIYILRARLAGNEGLGLRDALYAAGAPLVSTILMGVVIFVHLIPVFLVTYGAAAAAETGFLALPFNAFIFWLLTVGLSVLSLYLLSSSVMGLVAVTVPGTRPFAALNLASDLMAGRRVKFIVRLVFLVFLYFLALVAVVYPVILFDLWLKAVVSGFGFPIVSVVLLLVTMFFFIYGTAYLYLYYRELIDRK